MTKFDRFGCAAISIPEMFLEIRSHCMSSLECGYSTPKRLNFWERSFHPEKNGMFDAKARCRRLLCRSACFSPSFYSETAAECISNAALRAVPWSSKHLGSSACTLLVPVRFRTIFLEILGGTYFSFLGLSLWKGLVVVRSRFLQEPLKKFVYSEDAQPKVTSAAKCHENSASVKAAPAYVQVVLMYARSSKFRISWYHNTSLLRLRTQLRVGILNN